MFSGIVEAKGSIQRVSEMPGTLVIAVTRPPEFDDIKLGHSICVDGVCLTIEKFSDYEMEFSIAAETLKVTEWEPNQLINRHLNLERSLQFGGRVHGHLVTGHVETVINVLRVEDLVNCRILHFRLPKNFKEYVIPKGSVAINGVSLTVNEVTPESFSVCVIPETLKRTNLETLKSGDTVNFESDYLVKAMRAKWN